LLRAFCSPTIQTHAVCIAANVAMLSGQQPASRWIAYFREQWKRALVRASFRIRLAIGYYMDSTRAINRLLVTMPSEMIPGTLTKYGARIGEGTVIMPPMHVHNPGKGRDNHFANLTIGENCFIGPESFIDLSNQITIGHNVTISMRVALITHMDVGKSPLRVHHFPPKNDAIRLQDGAYLGANTTILKGVDIGECAVIGAGCVVATNVPAWTVVRGELGRARRALDH
jgi:acetyltransferase-like isoleucine patch superfamily enzyme